ncbi:uncharacterized protein LOC110669812 isoform X7 [Hevea brasiliensis]|uniref:uncharacterized protein LOC110669812 isoform X7 n=1 Tax=Hevea brasiliensis TaxID=3981 RepID=UPI0025FFF2DF|nr:uncharacterized protein LOC110669812 isoform X7 [Hevea brasiliensis]XP_057993539.1 uncharacterized protein LOC110669812 isoform X7 [Hevea brasiliensis]
MNSPFPDRDTTYTKLFVGGLAWETQSHTLRRHFQHYGDILEAVVIYDKNTGRSKGYGFVTFRDPDSARRACADPNPLIDGRRANCNLASLGRASAPQRSPIPPFGTTNSPRAAYPQPVPYGYQPGFFYPPYGYVISFILFMLNAFELELALCLFSFMVSVGVAFSICRFIKNSLIPCYSLDVFQEFLRVAPHSVISLFFFYLRKFKIFFIAGCVQSLCGSAICSGIRHARDC